MILLNLLGWSQANECPILNFILKEKIDFFLFLRIKQKIIAPPPPLDFCVRSWLHMNVHNFLAMTFLWGRGGGLCVKFCWFCVLFNNALHRILQTNKCSIEWLVSYYTNIQCSFHFLDMHYWPSYREMSRLINIHTGVCVNTHTCT